MGTDRRETADLTIEHYMLHADDQQIEVQFIPGSTGDSRVPYLLNRYFAVLFFLGNGLLAGLAFWGSRMMSADTWARKPGRRARP